jgi:hypothetical protein
MQRTRGDDVSGARPVLTAGGLAAGLLFFDILLNCAGFSPSFSADSLLRPSIDLLVVAAALLGTAQAGRAARPFLRALVCLLAMALAVYRMGSRSGFVPATAMGWLLAVLACAAGLALSWPVSLLVVRGFASGISRSVFLVIVALLAVAHVLTGNHVFVPSILPRIVRDIGSAFR